VGYPAFGSVVIFMGISGALPMPKFSGLVIVLSILVLSLPSVSVGDEKADQEATTKFKQYVSDLIARYKGEKHERIESGLGVTVAVCGMDKLDGYVKVAYEVGTYGIDVRKTDSLITPYVGVLELTWDSHSSRCHDTKEEAQADAELPKPGSFKYRYTYGFQDGKWVPQSREVRGMDSEGNEFHWSPCEGLNKQMIGCSVPN